MSSAIDVSNEHLVSIDVETSGLEVGKHVPLSIGAAIVPYNPKRDSGPHIVDTHNSFYVQLEWDDVIVDPKAMQVNKLNLAYPPGVYGMKFNHSLPAAYGISVFRKWLDKYAPLRIRALGLNVGSFDLPMLKSIWNQGGNNKWPFKYQSIDLNTLFYLLSRLQNRSFDSIKKEISDIAWRNNELMKMYGEHHALGDAWFNIYAWEECLRRLEEGYEVLC